MRLKTFKNNKGFSLLEMLIAIAIFSIITGASIGVFISAIRLQRYSLVSQHLLDQTSYAMEYMTRLIRMAKKDIDGDCLSVPKSNFEITRTGYGIKFENYKGPSECQEFYLENGQLYQEINGADKLPLTSDDLEVTDFKIYISGQFQTDDYQSRVTIFLGAEGKGLVPRPKIELQTTVSQRDIDIPE